MEEVDNRPRNPEHFRQIQEMFAPEKVRQYQYHLDSDDSIYDIQDSEDLLAYARKRILPHHDPANRIPMQISDSPISDYDIEFTRLNKTTDSLTPSMLSSLCIPATSNASLSLIINTPTRASLKPKTPRQSGVTPSVLLRQKQIANVNQTMGEQQRDIRKTSLSRFNPGRGTSTPVRAERTKPSFLNQLSLRPEAAPSTNGRTNENDQNEGNNTADRTLTNEMNKNTSIVPETQHNDSVIPETQDDYVPETQEDDALANNPVQAQVIQQNATSQAEPHLNLSTRGSIRSRPPIRGQSQITTPSRPAPAVLAPKTPSRLPVAVSRLSKINATSTPYTSSGNELRPSVENASSNPTNVDRNVVIITTPASQPAPAAPVAPTAIPANMTINVNVNGSLPQPLAAQASPSQSNAIPRNVTYDRNDHLPAHNRQDENNTDGILTDDSDSEEPNVTGFNTPSGIKAPGNVSNASVRRKLFPQEQNHERSARNASPRIDNLTRTIVNNDTAERSHRSFRKRSQNASALENEHRHSRSAFAVNSDTFVKQKLLLPNATFDVASSSRQTVNSARKTTASNAAEFLSLVSSNATTNSIGRHELPSEVHLDPIDLSDDNVLLDDGTAPTNGNTQTYGGPNDSSDASFPLEHPSVEEQMEQMYSALEPVDVDEEEQAQVELSKTANKSKRSSKRSAIEEENNDEQNEGRNGDEQQNEQKEIVVHTTNPQSPSWNPIVLVQRLIQKTPLLRRQPTPSRTPISKQSSNVHNIEAADHQSEVVNVSGASSKLRNSQPFGLFTPPSRFGDDFIDEHSPTTGERVINQLMPVFRQSLQPRRTDVPLKVKPRKRGTRSENSDLLVLNNNLSNLVRKSKSSQPTPRRLISVNELHESDERIENNESQVSNSRRSDATDKSSDTTGETVTFKKPTTRAPRNRKTQTSDRNESVSSDTSEEQYMATVHIEPMDDLNEDLDDDLNNDFADALPDDQSYTKETNVSPPKPNGKPKPKPKSKAPAAKKTKQTESTAVPEASQSVPAADDGPNGLRRSKRERQSVEFSHQLYRYKLLSAADYDNKNSKRTRKHTALDKGRQTVPEVPTYHDDTATEPPRKRARAQSHTPTALMKKKLTMNKASSDVSSKQLVKRHTSKKSSATASTSGANSSTSGASTSGATTSGHSTKSSKNKTSPKRSVAYNFAHKLKDSQAEIDWWDEILDMDKVDPIIHSADEVDVEYIIPEVGRVERSHTSKIDWKEQDDVQFGYLPFSTMHSGFMRFRPRASKRRTKSSQQIELFVLRGNFKLLTDSGDIPIYPATSITIPKGAAYGIVNASDCVGLIQFIYPLKKSD